MESSFVLFLLHTGGLHPEDSISNCTSTLISWTIETGLWIGQGVDGREIFHSKTSVGRVVTRIDKGLIRRNYIRVITVL